LVASRVQLLQLAGIIDVVAEHYILRTLFLYFADSAYLTTLRLGSLRVNDSFLKFGVETLKIDQCADPANLPNY